MRYWLLGSLLLICNVGTVSTADLPVTPNTIFLIDEANSTMLAPPAAAGPLVNLSVQNYSAAFSWTFVPNGLPGQISIQSSIPGGKLALDATGTAANEATA